MKRNGFVVFLILCIWFVISFVTNILGPIMPAIIDTYHISLTLAAFLPFSFFLAYGIMSVPAGILIERSGAKKAILLALAMGLVGAGLFAFHPAYGMALASLFIIGMGMAMLQVIINPLMRVAGGEEHFAFYSVLAQLVFGAASFVSPYVFVSLTGMLEKQKAATGHYTGFLDQIIPAGIPWIILYWLFALIFLIFLIIIRSIRLPAVDLKEDEKSGALDSYLYLLKKRSVRLYFFGLIAYVGTEQGLANWMSKFLNLYHGIDPEGQGAHTIALFWGLMSVGCLLGLLILKLADSKIVLKCALCLTMVSVACALFGPAQIALIAFPLCGFFLSVVFSIIFSLALNSEEKHHGSYSGILCSGIFGGALIPLIIGKLGDMTSLRLAMLFIFVPLLYMLFLAFIARPLIRNKTVSFRDLFKTEKV